MGPDPAGLPPRAPKATEPRAAGDRLALDPIHQMAARLGIVQPQNQPPAPMPAPVSDPYATGVPAAEGPVTAGDMPGAEPTASPDSFGTPATSETPNLAATAASSGNGEVDKVSIILAVVSFLIVIGMIVVLAMMKVE